MPGSGQTQKAHASLGDQGAVTHASASHEDPRRRETTVVNAEESIRLGSQRPSILEEDLEMSVTDDKDKEEEMDDGGQSSTDQDPSGEEILSEDNLNLLCRLHTEEAEDTALSESDIFAASLGNGNHRRESLNPLVCEESIMSQRNASVSIKTSSKERADESGTIHQPTKVKLWTDVQTRSGIICDQSPTIVSRTGSKQLKKKYHASKDEVTKRVRNNHQEDTPSLHTPRNNRRSLRELPSHTSTPKQASNIVICDYTVKCEFCGKRLQKKSMKYHITNMHLNKLFKCRKCGSKFLREPVRENHEITCAFSYEVRSQDS